MENHDCFLPSQLKHAPSLGSTRSHGGFTLPLKFLGQHCTSPGGGFWSFLPFGQQDMSNKGRGEIDHSWLPPHAATSWKRSLEIFIHQMWVKEGWVGSPPHSDLCTWPLGRHQGEHWRSRGRSQGAICTLGCRTQGTQLFWLGCSCSSLVVGLCWPFQIPVLAESGRETQVSWLSSLMLFLTYHAASSKNLSLLFSFYRW